VVGSVQSTAQSVPTGWDGHTPTPSQNAPTSSHIHHTQPAIDQHPPTLAIDYRPSTIYIYLYVASTSKPATTPTSSRPAKRISIETSGCGCGAARRSGGARLRAPSTRTYVELGWWGGGVGWFVGSLWGSISGGG
jgi:hypothetical protein